MKIYTWQVLGLCEVRFWKGSGIVETDNGNYLYYSGEEKYHINGVEFLFHKDIKYFITEFKPISSRICTSRLRAKSLIISIIQIHAPTSDYTDEQIEIFYSCLQDLVDKTHTKDILIIQVDGNAKIGNDSLTNWNKYCRPSYNNSTNDRIIRLLEFICYSDMILANTLWIYISSRIATWQTLKVDIGSDYDFVRKSFKQKFKSQRKKEQSQKLYHWTAK